MSSPSILSPISVSRVENSTFRSPTVSLVDSSPSSCNLDKLTCANIQSMLKAKPDHYVIIENTGKHTSNCWTVFGFPAIITSGGGLVMTKRRSSINPKNVDNILFLRSVTRGE